MQLAYRVPLRASSQSTQKQ